MTNEALMAGRGAASASIASTMRCGAVSAPMVMSVPDMSLSMDPTSLTIRGTGYSAAASAVISPDSTSSARASPLFAEHVGAGEGCRHHR